MTATQVIQEIERALEAGPTPGPWTFKDTPGAGLSIHVDVSKALDGRYSKDCPVYHLGNEAVTMQISYELWTQFSRQEWDDMQAANGGLIAACSPDNIRTLLARIKELEAARKQDLEIHQIKHAREMELMARIDALRRVLDGFEKDAERLDHLESLGNFEVLDMYQGPVKLGQGDDELGEGATLREAIDAAIAQSKKPEGV